MNKEIEIKVKITNPESVRKKLMKVAKFVKEKNQEDYYYVPKHSDYFLVTPTKEYLRVRVEGDEVSIGHHLCHYDQAGKLLRTDENETEVGDSKTIRSILDSLNFVLKVIVKKKRQVYDYGDHEIVLDRIDGLGDFMEIEVKDIKSTESEEKKICYKILEALEVEYSEAENGGYPDMLMRISRSMTG